MNCSHQTLHIAYYSSDESILLNRNRILQFKLIFLQTTKVLSMYSINSELPRRKPRYCILKTHLYL